MGIIIKDLNGNYVAVDEKIILYAVIHNNILIEGHYFEAVKKAIKLYDKAYELR